MVKLTVVTFKNPMEAHETLRHQSRDYDLVITDLHMPQMKGTDLQKQVQDEFNLPVIIMSSDDRESVMLNCLEGGAVFYIVKPVNPTDLKNIWQYAIAAKKGKGIATSCKEKVSSCQTDSSSSSNKKVPVDDDHDDDGNDSVSVNQGSIDHSKKGNKKRKKQGHDQGGDQAPLIPKKAKMSWTNQLHNRFLQAINHIGLDKAVPKRILVFMGVPGLTRENVASHLQKYRIFLKKVAERTANCPGKNFSDRNYKSNFALSPTSMSYKHSQQECPQYPRGLQQITSSFQAGCGGMYGASNTNGALCYPDQKISISNSVPQVWYGQSSLLGNSNGIKQTMFNPPYQADRARMGLQSKGIGHNLASSYAALSTSDSLKNCANDVLYQYKLNIPRLNNQSQCQFGPSSYVSGLGNRRGNTTNSYQLPINGNNNNYSGFRLTTNLERPGLGQVLLNGKGSSGYSLMNWKSNDTAYATPIGNEAVGYQAPTGSSTTAGNFQTINGVNQENSSQYPAPTSQQQQFLASEGGSNNGGAFNLSENIPSALNTVSNQQQQQQLGEGEIDEILFELTNNLNPLEQQAGKEVLTTNTPISSCLLVSASFNDILNEDLSATTPWTDNSSLQLQGGDQTLNPRNGGTASFMNDYFPTFEQGQGNIDCVNSELNGIPAINDVQGENEGWSDEFLNSLLSS